MDAFASARKLVDTPFPYPHAHFTAVCMAVFVLTSPVLFLATVESVWLGGALNFISATTCALTPKL